MQHEILIDVTHKDVNEICGEVPQPWQEFRPVVVVDPYARAILRLLQAAYEEDQRHDSLMEAMTLR